jgi:hypothetical protein
MLTAPEVEYPLRSSGVPLLSVILKVTLATPFWIEAL